MPDVGRNEMSLCPRHRFLQTRAIFLSQNAWRNPTPDHPTEQVIGIVQKCLHGLRTRSLTPTFVRLERAGTFSAVTGGRAQNSPIELSHRKDQPGSPGRQRRPRNGGKGASPFRVTCPHANTFERYQVIILPLHIFRHFII